MIVLGTKLYYNNSLSFSLCIYCVRFKMPLKWPFIYTKTESFSCWPFSRVKKVAKMLFGTFTISAVKALQDLSDLGLYKNGKKSATLPNITAILNKNGVQVQEIPSDRVRFCKSTFFCMVAVLSQQSVCV